MRPTGSFPARVTVTGKQRSRHQFQSWTFGKPQEPRRKSWPAGAVIEVPRNRVEQLGPKRGHPLEIGGPKSDMGDSHDFQNPFQSITDRRGTAMAVEKLHINHAGCRSNFFFERLAKLTIVVLALEKHLSDSRKGPMSSTGLSSVTGRGYFMKLYKAENKDGKTTQFKPAPNNVTYDG